MKLLQDATKLPPDTLSKGNTVRSGEVLFQAGGISLRGERTNICSCGALNCAQSIERLQI